MKSKKTLRDYFAAHAMSGLIAHYGVGEFKKGEATKKAMTVYITHEAYEIADMMVQKRKT